MTTKLQEAIRLLQDLANLQNGAPLEQHRDEWQKTMDEVYAFLASVDNTIVEDTKNATGTRYFLCSAFCQNKHKATFSNFFLQTEGEFPTMKECKEFVYRKNENLQYDSIIILSVSELSVSEVSSTDLKRFNSEQ